MILSHMRSGSSLLTQLLASHDEIVGYGELFLGYRRRSDLWALNGKALSVSGQKTPRGKYAIDKVLHDYLLETDNYARIAEEVRPIILVREPAGSIGSLITSFGMSGADAFEYYTGRLRTLARYVEAGGAVALSYEQLIHRTNEVFHLLEQFLDLEVPLQETYRPRSRGSDPSANLRAGRILRDDKVVDHRATVEESLLRRAEYEYARTWDRLTECCQMIDSK
jgi:hypothetical protein